jgi:hypothetical protein
MSTPAPAKPRHLPSWRHFLSHFARNALIVFGFIALSLAIGAFGYHWVMHLPWLDATLNASMILTGMGPLAAYPTRSAKLFGIFYSLFSGVTFLTSAAVLLSPIVARFLHRFHLDVYGEQ